MLALLLKNGERLKYPICFKNNGPHITVSLIFWLMTFNLYFHHQFWVNLICIQIGNSSGYTGHILCLTLNEMHIELAPLIDDLTDTSSTPPPEVIKNSNAYSTLNTFTYLKIHFLLLYCESFFMY